jgi:MEMO1 family protein
VRLSPRGSVAVSGERPPAVAGTFYPRDAGVLARLVDRQAADARAQRPSTDTVSARLAGILVPHAGLEYSGVCAAAGWTLLADTLEQSGATAPGPPTIVLLGTVHRAWWLDGVGVWDAGPWRTPLGDVEIDTGLARAVAELGRPFVVDREAHLEEHSLEVQLPFVRRLLPDARIVPLAVAAGTGPAAAAAGMRLGALLAQRGGHGGPVVIAVSTDMAHYPPAAIGERVTEDLAPYILSLDPTGLATAEAEVTGADLPGIACGMCGIAPSVLGLAALRAMGAGDGSVLMTATSADVGAPADRTVGYLAVGFPA